MKAGLLVPDMILIMPARATVRNDEASLVASEIYPIEEAEQHLTKAVHVRLQMVKVDPSLLQRLAETLGAYPGKCDVYLHCVTTDRTEVTVHATSACRVSPSSEMRAKVVSLLGEDALWFAGGNGLPRHEYEDLDSAGSGNDRQRKWRRKKSQAEE